MAPVLDFFTGLLFWPVGPAPVDDDRKLEEVLESELEWVEVLGGELVEVGGIEVTGGDDPTTSGVPPTA
jgi:hypothetical protein